MSLTPQKGIASFFHAPVVYVTGKGGVGKTTIAAAIAVATAQAGRRAALVEFDDEEAGKRALHGSENLVDHVVVTYEKAVEAAISPIVGGGFVARTILRQHALKRLIRAMPALREFVSLEQVRVLAASGDYDTVVVDLPASGHALDWLRVPQAFARFLRGGPLGTLGGRVYDEVIAKGKSEVVIVALAEPLVIKETEELAARYLAEFERRPALVVVNRIASRDPEGALVAARKLEAARPDDPDTREFARLLGARADLANDAFEALRVARGLDQVRVLAVPEAAADPAVTDVVRWLDLSVRATS